MIYLRVREFVETHTKKLSRYKLGRDAGLSPSSMDKLWKEPETTSLLLSTLEKIAHALSPYVGRYVSTKELYEDIPDEEFQTDQDQPSPLRDEGQDKEQ